MFGHCISQKRGALNFGSCPALLKSSCVHRTMPNLFLMFKRNTLMKGRVAIMTVLREFFALVVTSYSSAVHTTVFAPARPDWLRKIVGSLI